MIIKKRFWKIYNHAWEFEWSRTDNTSFESLFDVEDKLFEWERDYAINHACEQLVASKIYSSVKAAKSAIEKRKIGVHFTVTFVDSDKLSNAERYSCSVLETHSRKQIFDEYCAIVLFDWDSMNNQNIMRKEQYGPMRYDMSHRFEKNDYEEYEFIYKFGDVVELKNPISGRNYAVIINVERPTGAPKCSSYSALLLKDANRRPSKRDELALSHIHQNDIELCAGQNLNLAKRVVAVHHDLFPEEYSKFVLGEDYKK